RHRAPAPSRAQAERLVSHDLTVGGVPLFVRRWGTRGDAPLMFLHALGPASSAAFLGLGVGPLEEGYDVAAPDLPGYGGGPPGAPDAHGVPAPPPSMAALPP